MPRFAALMTFLLLLVAGCAAKEGDSPKGKPGKAEEEKTTGAAEKAELEKLQGAWDTVTVAQDIVEIPAEDAKKYKLVVKGDTYTLTNGDETIEGTLTLDPTKKPKHLDAKRSKGPDAGKVIKAVYKLEKDKFEVCLGAPGGPRPTDFGGQDVGGVRTYFHKRAKR